MVPVLCYMQFSYMLVHVYCHVHRPWTAACEITNDTCESVCTYSRVRSLIPSQFVDAAAPYEQSAALCKVQVSWCKLEVEMTTPKSVFMASAEGQPQDMPPLVVAALNLKTRFNAQVAASVHEVHLVQRHSSPQNPLV